MPTRKKSRKSRSNKRYKRHSKSYFSGGNCSACGSCMQNAPASPLFRGGNTCNGKTCIRRIRGGNDNQPSFQGIPLRYYYGQNTHMNDPIDPSHQLATRQLPNKMGGKKRTQKNKRGGAGLNFSFLSGQYGTPSVFNPLNTIGDIGTSQIASNILSGNINTHVLPNASVFHQPVNTKYNMHNMPLA